MLFTSKVGNSCKPLYSRSRALWVLPHFMDLNHLKTIFSDNFINHCVVFAVRLPLMGVVKDLNLTFAALAMCYSPSPFGFSFRSVFFYTKPLVARRGFEPLVFRMKIWCPRPLDERAKFVTFWVLLATDLHNSDMCALRKAGYDTLETSPKHYRFSRDSNRTRTCDISRFTGTALTNWATESFFFGDPAGARTQDPDIKSVVL